MTKQLREWAQEILEENHGPPFSKLAEDISALLAERDRLREALDCAVEFMRDQGYDFCPAEEFQGTAQDTKGWQVLHDFARGENAEPTEQEENSSRA